jgi:hypothetical protein
VIRTNIAVLQGQVRTAHRTALDQSHHGFGQPATLVRRPTGGRPHIEIDREWLQFAHTIMPTSAIARLLSISRRTVRESLVAYGIAERGEQPILRLRAGSSLASAVRSARQNLRQSTGESSCICVWHLISGYLSLIFLFLCLLQNIQLVQGTQRNSRLRILYLAMSLYRLVVLLHWS